MTERECSTWHCIRGTIRHLPVGGRLRSFRVGGRRSAVLSVSGEGVPRLRRRRVETGRTDAELERVDSVGAAQHRGDNGARASIRRFNCPGGDCARARAHDDAPSSHRSGLRVQQLLHFSAASPLFFTAKFSDFQGNFVYLVDGQISKKLSRLNLNLIISTAPFVKNGSGSFSEVEFFPAHGRHGRSRLVKARSPGGGPTWTAVLTRVSPAFRGRPHPRRGGPAPVPSALVLPAFRALPPRREENKSPVR